MQTGAVSATAAINPTRLLHYAMYADLERFLEAVARLLSLWHEGLVRLEPSPQGVRLALDEAGGNDERLTPGGGLYVDIGDAISAAAAGTPLAEFVAARQQPRLSFPTTEEPDVARAKYEAARELVEVAGIGQSMNLFFTSKLPVLASHEWEVVNRVAESASRPRTQLLRYAILQLTAERASPDGETSREMMVAAVDERQLDALIDDLTRLRDALAIDRGMRDAEAEDDQSD